MNNWFRALFVVSVVLVWALLAHFVSIQQNLSNLSLTLGLLPLLFALALALHACRHIRWLSLLSVVVVAVSLWWLWPLLRTHLVMLYYLQHLGVMLFFGVLFGRSLIGDAQPLVTRLALLIHPQGLSTRKERYTRQVTLAWALFFIIVALLSTLLFFFASRVLWSIYANFLTAPLVGLMFAGEYFCRCRALPLDERPGFMDAVHAWRSARHKGET